MFTIKPIRNAADYSASLEAIESRMMAELGSAEADQLEILSMLVEVYEEKHYAIDAPDPIEAIKFHMEQRGLQRADFAAVVGQNRATELLKKQRKLNIDHIRAIVDVWHMPLRALIADYKLTKHV